MRAPAKLAAYAVVLAIAVGGGAAVGAAAGPIDVGGEPDHPTHSTGDPATDVPATDSPVDVPATEAPATDPPAEGPAGDAPAPTPGPEHGGH